MKGRKTAVVIAVALICVLLVGVLAACADGQDGVGIKSIEKTGTDGNVDTYTVTYTDGSTFSFRVTNGTDGRFGRNRP